MMTTTLSSELAAKLRQLHQEIALEISTAYGWGFADALRQYLQLLEAGTPAEGMVALMRDHLRRLPNA